MRLTLCVRLGYTCTYRDRARNRARQDAVIRQLQERVRQTEALLVRRTDASLSSSSTRSFVSEEHGGNTPPTEASLLLPASASHSHAPTRTPSLPSPTPTIQAKVRDLFASADGMLISPKHGFLSSMDCGVPDFSGFEMNLDLDMPLPFALPEPTELPPRPEEDTAAPSGLVSSADGLPAELLAQLHDLFFQNFSPALPIIAKASFYRRLAEYPDSTSTRCISYSVALLGTVVSEQYRHQWKSCYTLARQYVDACERDDMPDSLASISLLQALLCVTRFDIGRRNCARAYITLSRAVRLASMMQLEQMDQTGTGSNTGVPSAVRIELQTTHDLLDLEERRRCFWGLYILEGYASIHHGTSRVPSHTELPKLFLFLPCPGALDDTFNPQSMPYLDGAKENDTTDTVSPFAGLSIVVSLIGQVLEHVSNTKLGEPGFWDRHYALVKTIEVHSPLLKPLFSLRTLYSDAVALDVYLSFQAVTMLLYQTSLRQGEEQGIASEMLVSDSKKRLLSTALGVASTVKSTWAMQKKNIDSLSLSGAFVAWPLSLAIQVLRQNILEGDTGNALPFLAG
ncbi:transcription factor [Colletotrichum tofieldiae]|nr:transcription factor [Colletotrichum tofieldiae]